MRQKTKQLFMRISVLLMLFVVLFTSLVSKQTAYAAEYTSYDNTDIETDLADIDVSMYPQNDDIRHRLLDEVGFMEYAYSDSLFIADNYYGLYFYVYNPTEKPVSLSEGAHHVNMATKYDENGEPSDYENVEITFLDATANNRFLKFKLSDSRRAYDMAVTYAGKHDNVRRYDIASVQLLFQGDDHATDSFAGAEGLEGVSFTYYCTGYCAGCGADPEAESTLDIQYKKLDTIGLQIQSTWYRTDRFDGEKRNTLSSVYFAIPNDYITQYGALQIVKAEWYEYKMNWAFVSDSDEVINALTPYLGYELPYSETSGYYDDSVPFEVYQYLGPSDSGQQGLGWNKAKSVEQMQRFDWLIEVDDIGKTASPDLFENWANNYPVHAGDEALTVDGRTYNANLFSDEVDEGHTRGYNVREFDARDESQWIDLKTVNQTNGWKTFWNSFLPAGSRDEDWLVAEDVRPIEEITPERLNGNDTSISNDILVDTTELSDLRKYVDTAEKENETVYMLRFSVSEYNAVDMEYHDDGDWSGFDYIDFVAMQDTVYLAFDIIYLGFVKGDDVTIIPVVADPVDIYPAYTPTEKAEGDVPWWAYVVLVLGELLILLALRFVLCKLCGLPNWVFLILLVVVVVLNIFFITSWAAWVGDLLEPYMKWIPS